MAYINIGTLDQLQLEIPTERTENWGTRLKDNFVVRIAEHDHSGNGKGAPLGATALASDSVNDTKILLNNNTSLRSKGVNPVDTVNLFKVNTNDLIEQGANLQSIKVEPVSADPVSPSEGEIQVSDGTARPEGAYTYINGAWVSSPNNITVSNQGTGEGLFIQKTGDDLELKTLVAGPGVEITSTATEITVSRTPNRSTQVQLRSLTASNSVSTETFFNAIFTNLVVGKKYRLEATMQLLTGTGAAQIRSINNAVDQSSINGLDISFAANTSIVTTLSMIGQSFISDGSAINIVFSPSGGVMDARDTYIKLIEINDEIEGGF